jgi:acetone carboxylase gamma subunit
MHEPEYPSWICADCGKQHGRIPKIAHFPTYHIPDPDNENDFCGWCGSKTKDLTEPRDFLYPPAPAR